MTISHTSRRALVITGHPDDETICLGGTIALLAARCVRVTVCCATRGEGGEVGDPPVCAPAELGAVREAELRCAAGVLGAGDVVFLGYEDPRPAPGNVMQAASADPEELAHRVLAVMRQVEPRLVVTHGSDGEYGHPQHLAMHQAVLAASRRWGRRGAALYTFAAAAPPQHTFSHFRNESDPVSVELDIAGVLATKESAFACHRSQIGCTLRDAGLPAGTRTIFPPWEALRRRRGPAVLEQWLGLAEPSQGAALLSDD